MGQKLSILAQTTPYIDISSYIDIFDDIQFIKNLNNNSKFISTNQCVTLNDDLLITKVFIKPNLVINEPSTAQYVNSINEDNSIEINFSLIQQNLNNEIAKLEDVPNTISYFYILDTPNAAYLFRPYIHESLKENLSESKHYGFETTRIMTLFKIFQMLKIVGNVHDKNIIHGNINMNNFLVDSLDIIKLTDFSMNLKPFYLREDMPNEIDFYFGKNNHTVVRPSSEAITKGTTMGIDMNRQKYKRQGFYLAPERLNTQKRNVKVDMITDAIKKSDVFSLGCVFYEMFMTLSQQSIGRNVSLFSIQDIFNFKNGDYAEYEKNMAIIDEIFGRDSSLESQLIKDCTNPDVSKRLTVKEILDKYTRNGLFPSLSFNSMYENICLQLNDIDMVDFKFPAFANNIKDVCLSIGYELETLDNKGPEENKVYELNEITNIPNEYNIFESHVYKYLKYSELLDKYDATLLKQNLGISYIHILGKLLSTSLSNVNDIILCINNITLLSQFCEDALKLDVCIPYLFDFFNECENKQCKKHLLEKIILILKGISESTDKITQENLHDTVNYYIFPTFKKNLKLYENETIKIILNGLPNLLTLTKNTKYLKKALISIISHVLTTQESSTIALRIELLKQIPKFLNVIGEQVLNDLIIVHAITYLNEDSPLLKFELINCLCKIGEYEGEIIFKEIIYPLLIQNLYLYQDNESVMLVVLQNLKEIIESYIDHEKVISNESDKIIDFIPESVDQSKINRKKKLLDKYGLLDLIENHLLNFLLLPYKSCKVEVISILKLVVLNNIELSELYCLYYPLIKPYYHMNMEINKELLECSCRSSISSDQFDYLLLWYMKVDSTLFWKEKRISGDKYEYEYTNYFDKNNFDENLSMEDKIYVNNLKKHFDLDPKHLWKLSKLRKYIKKVAGGLPSGFKANFIKNMEKRNHKVKQKFNIIDLQNKYGMMNFINIRTDTFDYQIVFNDERVAGKKRASSGYNSRRNSKLIPQRLLNDALKSINDESAISIEEEDHSSNDLEQVLLIEYKKSEYTVNKTIKDQNIKDKNVLGYIENLKVIPELNDLKELEGEDETYLDVVIPTDKQFKANLSNYTKVNFDCGRKIKFVESSERYLIVVNEEMKLENQNKLEIIIFDLINFDNSSILDTSKFIKKFDLSLLLSDSDGVSVTNLKFWMNDIFVVSFSNGQNDILKLHRAGPLSISKLKSFNIYKPEFLINLKFANGLIYGMSSYSSIYEYNYVNNELKKVYEYQSKVMEEMYDSLDIDDFNFDYEVCKDFSVYDNHLFIVTTMNNLYVINMDFKIVKDVYTLYQKKDSIKGKDDSVITPFDTVNAYQNGKLVLTGGYSLSLMMIFNISDFIGISENNLAISKEVIMMNSMSYYSDDLYDKFILRKVLQKDEFLKMRNIDENINTVKYEWIDDKKLVFMNNECNDVVLMDIESGVNSVMFDNHSNNDNYKKYNMNNQLKLYYRNVNTENKKPNLIHFKYIQVDSESSILVVLDVDSNLSIYNIYQS